MRIALYHNLPEGGAHRFLRETVPRSAQTHEHHLFRIVARSDNPTPVDDFGIHPASIHDVELQQHLVPLTRRFWRARQGVELAALWSAEGEVAQQIDAGGFDLCVVHPCRMTQSPSLLTHLKTPTIYYAHEIRRLSFERAYAQARNWAHYPHDRLLESATESVLRRADRRAVQSATALATNSIFTSEAILRAYGRQATVVYAGIDRNVFTPTGSPRGDYVLSVGALDPVKGHETVIRALGTLGPTSRPVFKIVFERQFPNYDETLRKLAAKHKVQLELHHHIGDQELASLYSRARAAVCAARLEPFGVTPLESLNCGTPVVAINEGGFRESVTQGRNGLLVTPTIAGIAAGLSRVLEGALTDDPAELRASVDSWTWDRAVTSLHRAYDAAIREGLAGAD